MSEKKTSSDGKKFRSSISGKYVEKGYAKKHPATTVGEKAKKKKPSKED